MISKFKALGVAALTVVAMSAITASSAQAANFTASSYPAVGTASSAQENEDMVTEAGSVECKAHFVMAAISEGTSSITVTPTYTECKTWGWFNGSVNMNGCDYVFYTSGAFDLKCPTGKVVVITGFNCEVQIAGQNSLVGMDLKNNGTGISIQATVGGINYTVTKDGFGCPYSGTGAKTGASYIQNSAVQLSSPGGATLDIG